MKICKKQLHHYSGRRCNECVKNRIKKWTKINQEKMSTYQKNYRDSNSKNLKRVEKLYGISAEKYQEMLTNQKTKCAICERHQLQFRRRLSVDHCHETGKVRGLLCDNCNHGIGLFYEKIDRLKKAIKYLENA